MGKFNYFISKEKRLEKLSSSDQEDLIFDLINAFALANSPLDSALLLGDLLTEDEIKNLSKRLRIAKLLLKGTTHEEIVQDLHCSFATITKVRIWLENGGNGLKKVIEKLPLRRRADIPKRISGVGYGLPNIIDYYLSTALKEREKKNLKKFVEGMREKTARDKDLKEETDAEFRKIK